MKKISLLLFTFLLTLSYSGTAIEKEQAVHKQATTNAAQLPSVQTVTCSPYPSCGDGKASLQKTQSLLDWFAKQILTLEQNKDSSSK